MEAIWDAYPATLPRALEHTCRRVPDKPCMVFNETTVTWGQLDDISDRLASHLIDLGVERAGRVGMMCSVRPEYVALYMACAKIGAILVGFNVLYRPAEVRKLAERTTPTVCFVLREDRDRPLLSEIEPALRDAVPDVTIIDIEPSDRPFGGRIGRILDGPLPAGRRDAIRRRSAEVAEEDGALIVFTSGSTGLPKATVLTHRNLRTNLAVQIRSFGMTGSDRILVHLPMNHVAAATELVVPAVMLGATMVMLERFHPRATLEAVQRHRVTMLHQVPTMYIMEFALPDFEAFDLSSLRICCVAGAVTPPAVMARMLQVSPLVVTGYGMTEMTGFVTYTKPEDSPRTISYTVGRIAPEFELRIVDDQRRPLARGQSGEVALRGDCRFRHYHEDQQATAEAVDADGWYYTGDVGYLDEDECLVLVDRKKMMYITGGYNVYPREIEDVVNAMESVAMCACIGVRDEVRGEVGALFVVLREGVRIGAQEIEAHCRASLADYKVPHRIELSDTLPLTPLGKIDKQALKAAATARAGHAC
jgi:acyl-CoA synthetase (AMP-forming)/AMP-acid ligase II